MTHRISKLCDGVGDRSPLTLQPSTFNLQPFDHYPTTMPQAILLTTAKVKYSPGTPRDTQYGPRINAVLILPDGTEAKLWGAFFHKGIYFFHPISLPCSA
jgi:hypothetical protein